MGRREKEVRIQDDDSLHSQQLSLTQKNAPLHGKDWELAQQRLLLYLRVLNIPVVQRLELALDALKRASENSGGANHVHPVTNAMRIVRELLAEQGLDKPNETALQKQNRCVRERILEASSKSARQAELDRQPMQDGQCEPGPPFVAPPVNRSPMVPKDIDRKPLRSFISRHLKRFRNKNGPTQQK